MTLWSGRFSTGMDEALWNLSESYSFDHVLATYDITGSQAHVRGLVAGGLLTDAEGATLLATLEDIRTEFAEGRFDRGANDEDIHMAIERRATELAGDVGRRIHTARSRNDQVATTLRLFTRDAVTVIAEQTLALIDRLRATSDRYPGAYLPGYTHLQRAQPVLLAHHLAAHCWALLRDVDRLMDARERMNVSPLGAGAIAGTSLPIQPTLTAEALQFRDSFANSMDAVSDRDFVAETLFDIALLGTHLSRMGEELVLWTSAEFNFATLGDAFTTGSSMLPQKKNSDVAELARGKSGRLVGNLTALLVTLKGLPLAYNRDMQEDKEPLFDSVRHVQLVLGALGGAYESLEFNVVSASSAADDELLVAIDIAEELVAQGMPFRSAHDVAGNLVGQAIRESRTLRDVTRDAYGARFDDLFTEGTALARRRSRGAAGPVAWPEQNSRLVSEIARMGARISQS